MLRKYICVHRFMSLSIDYDIAGKFSIFPLPLALCTCVSKPSSWRQDKQVSHLFEGEEVGERGRGAEVDCDFLVLTVLSNPISPNAVIMNIDGLPWPQNVSITAK